MVLDEVGLAVFVKFLRHRLAYGRAATVVWNERPLKLEVGAWQMRCAGTSCTITVSRRSTSLDAVILRR